ncbi:GerAB/ArcD/ProY family transporter [Cohnella soli]|uniref:Endospore germination permease n=1 Tax=Cohnella soli TaxID=425005 RepID=A0ABW0HY44_9BACL
MKQSFSSDGKISTSQFTCLVSIYMVGSAILMMPSILASGAKQDAWIAALLGIGCTLLWLPCYVKLGTAFPHLTVIGIIENLLGRWLGLIVSMLFIGFPLMIASLTLRNIGDFLATQVLDETPMEAIHFLFLTIVIMGVYAGVETIARSAEVFFPWIVALFVIMLALLSPTFHMDNLRPVLGDGFAPIVRAAIPFLGFPLAEPFVLLMLFPSVNRGERAGKALVAGIMFGGGCLFIMTLAAILTLGADKTATLQFSSYFLAQTISIGSFLERIEIIMAIIWFITIYYRLTILFYAITKGFSQMLKFDEHRFLAMPIGLIVFALSILLIPNTTALLAFNTLAWPYYAMTMGIALPLFLLVIGWRKIGHAGQRNH